jgi:hypothetical protein
MNIYGAASAGPGVASAHAAPELEASALASLAALASLESSPPEPLVAVLPPPPELVGLIVVATSVAAIPPVSPARSPPAQPTITAPTQSHDHLRPPQHP